MSAECFIDSARQVVTCEGCKESIPMPLGAVDWVCDVIRTFSRVHAGCAIGDDRRWHIKPDNWRCRFAVAPQAIDEIKKP